MTRAELNQVFREAASMEFSDVPCEETQISFSFSDRFIGKMNKMIECQEKFYWQYVNTVGKRIVSIVIIVLSFFLIAFSNEKIRASMLQWCTEVYEEYGYRYYYFEGDMTTSIEVEYTLEFVPDGFEIISRRNGTKCKAVEYENKAGNRICLTQCITEDFGLYVDNENLEWSSVIINNREVKLFESERIKGALWVMDRYMFVLYYTGCDDFELIINMVESMLH